MTLQIDRMITDLFVNENAKKALHIAKRVLCANSGNVRDAFALLVVAGEGCGVSSYGKVYSAIVDTSVSQPDRGASSFLELVFPKDNALDEKLFFASPRRKASTRNRFSGTMLISLKEFTGQDLIKGDSFYHLLEFIEQNKPCIHFVFHVLPEFTAKNELIARLQEVVNITEVFLDKPDLENSYTYVITELERQGYTVDVTARKDLKERVLPDLLSKRYMGYKSLNNLISRLNFEAAVAADSEELVINEYAVKKLMVKLDNEKKFCSCETTQMGFRK